LREDLVKQSSPGNAISSGRFRGRRSLTILFAAVLGLAGLADSAAAQPIVAGDTAATRSSTPEAETSPAAAAADRTERRCVYPRLKRCVSITVSDGWVSGASAIRDVGGDGHGYRVAAEWLRFQYQVDGQWKTRITTMSQDGWWATKDSVGRESYGNYICNTGYRRVRLVGYFKWVHDGSNKVSSDMVATPSIVC